MFVSVFSIEIQRDILAFLIKVRKRRASRRCGSEGSPSN